MSSHTAAHAAAMDRLYRGQRHFYDITRKYYLIGRDRMIAELAPIDGATVLEIGCGTGRNLVKTANRYPKARLFGLDISKVMLRSAEGSARRAGVDDQVTLALGDATLFDPQETFRLPSFDRIFATYSISMIPGWEKVIEHAVELTAPGGSFSVVDFGFCEGWPKWCQKALHGFLAKFRVTPRRDLVAVMQRAADAAGARLEVHSLWRDYVLYLKITKPADV